MNEATFENHETALFFSVEPTLIADETHAGADRFDVTRGAREVAHQAFGGGGPHFCQGANLANRIVSVSLQEILRRLPDIERAGDISRVRSTFINSLASLPVTFTPTG